MHLIKRKYSFNFSFITYVCIILFSLYFVSCTPKIYYTPEYINSLILQEELDSIALIKAQEAKQEAKEKKIEDKKRMRDSLIQLKEKRKQDRLQKKQAKTKVKKKTPPVPKSNSTTEKPPNPPKKQDTATASKDPDTSKNKPPPSKTKTSTTPKKKTPPPKKEFKISKDAIKDIFSQSAKEVAIFDKEGNIKLIGNTSNKLQDMDLLSDTLNYDYTNKLMYANPAADSTGQLLDNVSFKQGNKNFRMESMIYNPLSKRALFDQVHTKEGELFVHTEKVRQDNDSVFFGKKAIFTTCGYYPPHFSFRSNKYKLVKGRVIVTGSLYAYFEGIPIPPKVFILPFAVLPMPKQRNSGLIIPTIVPSGINGFELSNFGWYFVLSPYVDLKVLGSYAALGVYGGSLASNFQKKYLYNGNASVDVKYIRTGNSGDADFNERLDYGIRLNYTLNRNVNPTISFNANINLTSSANYNLRATNLSTQNRLNNTFNSTVSFSKKIRKGFIENISTNLTINHNTTSQLIVFTFPSVNIQSRQINPIYFFSNRKNLGTKWYDKLRLSYRLQFSNAASIQEDKVTLAKFLDTSRWTASQSFPLELSLPKIGPITVSPNINYSQNLLGRRTFYQWDVERSKIDTIKERGIFVRHSLSTGFSLNFDDLIGSLQFGPNSRLKAIRHVMQISPNFSYTPDVREGEFFSFQVDSLGNTRKINYYTGSSYIKQESGKVGLTFNNIIQAKWLKKKKKSKNDSTENQYEEKKADIVNVRLSTSYDLIADSFNLSNINLNYTTKITEKLTFSGSANFDPYVYANGRRTRRLLLQDGIIGLGELTSINLSFSFGLKGGDKNKASPTSEPNTSSHLHDNSVQRGEAYPNERYDIINSTRDLLRFYPDRYVDFSIPWSLNFGVSTNYNRGSYNTINNRFDGTVVTNVNISGDVSLTKKWKLGVRGIFDVIKGDLTSFNIDLSRDLHCWQLSITLVPIGPIKSFGFLIRPKATILQDLKIEERRTFF